MGRRGRRVRQRSDVGQAADALHLLLVLEALLQGQQVNALLLIEHFHQRLKQSLVAQIVKNQVARLEFLDALAQALVRREQDAPQHGLLGLVSGCTESITATKKPRTSFLQAEDILKLFTA